MAFETVRIGPSIIFSQWSMERTIGNLGEEIRQHSNAFANLAQRGLRRCQVNTLRTMFPDIGPSETVILPRGAKDIGDGYQILPATEKAITPVTEAEANAIRAYLWHLDPSLDPEESFRVRRWARARLPNGQIARSRWKEEVSRRNNIRTGRNVKVSICSQTYEDYKE